MSQKKYDENSHQVESDQEEKKQPKKPSEIESRTLPMSDGTEEEAYTAGDAAILLGVTPSAFTIIRKRRGMKLYKLGYGADRYALKKDILALLTAQPVEE